MSIATATQPPLVRMAPDVESTPRRSEARPSPADRALSIQPGAIPQDGRAGHPRDRRPRRADRGVAGQEDDERTRLISWPPNSSSRASSTRIVPGRLVRHDAETRLSLTESGSEPEPDAKIVRGARPRDYQGASRRAGGRGPWSSRWLTTSLRDDQVVKKVLYAQIGSVPVLLDCEHPGEPAGSLHRPDRSRPGPRLSEAGRPQDRKTKFMSDARRRQEVGRIAVADLLP